MKHQGHAPAKKPLGHHSDFSSPGPRFTRPNPARTPFTNVGDTRQKSHGFPGPGHSGGQGHERSHP